MEEVTTWAEQHEEPTTRLTRMADVAIQAIEAHPEYRESDQFIIFLDEAVEDHQHQGGMVISGYADHSEALTSIFMHMQAIMKANGFRLDLMAMNDDGVTRVEG